jgi:glutathione S-transferase
MPQGLIGFGNIRQLRGTLQIRIQLEQLRHPMPTLLQFPLDPFSRRIRLALAEYGVATELTEERPWTPSVTLFNLNPAGIVPVFVEDGGAPISGIEAITEYLEETRGERVSLIPGTSSARAEVRRLMGWFDTKFYAEVSEPIITEKIIRRFMTRETGGGAPDMARVRYGMSRLRDHLEYIGTLADRRSWLAGEDISIADLAAASHLSVIDYLGDIPWAEFPVAKRWYQRIKSRPSFRSLLSDTVRGMPPHGDYANLDF